MYFINYLFNSDQHLRFIGAVLFSAKTPKECTERFASGKPEAHFFAISKETKKWQKTIP
jgi:hypothetical protein